MPAGVRVVREGCRGSVGRPVSRHRPSRCFMFDIWLALFFFFQAEDGIRDLTVTGVQTCALPISDAWLDHMLPLAPKQFMVKDPVKRRRPDFNASLKRFSIQGLTYSGADIGHRNADRKSVV